MRDRITRKVGRIELSFQRQKADDYEFTLGGVVFYVDKKVREANYFVTF